MYNHVYYLGTDGISANDVHWTVASGEVHRYTSGTSFSDITPVNTRTVTADAIYHPRIVQGYGTADIVGSTSSSNNNNYVTSISWTEPPTGTGYYYIVYQVEVRLNLRYALGGNTNIRSESLRLNQLSVTPQFSTNGGASYSSIATAFTGPMEGASTLIFHQPKYSFNLAAGRSYMARVNFNVGTFTGTGSTSSPRLKVDYCRLIIGLVKAIS